MRNQETAFSLSQKSEEHRKRLVIDKLLLGKAAASEAHYVKGIGCAPKDERVSKVMSSDIILSRKRYSIVNFQ